MRTACGTPCYVAPEILKGGKYDNACDLWSLGVILYILLSGSRPFYHENTNMLYKLIRAGDYDFPPFWKERSDSAQELVRGLLTVDPTKRMTIKEVLAHPWIVGTTASSKPFDSSYPHRLKVF